VDIIKIKPLVLLTDVLLGLHEAYVALTTSNDVISLPRNG